MSRPAGHVEHNVVVVDKFEQRISVHIVFVAIPVGMRSVEVTRQDNFMPKREQRRQFPGCEFLLWAVVYCCEYGAIRELNCDRLRVPQDWCPDWYSIVGHIVSYQHSSAVYQSFRLYLKGRSLLVAYPVIDSGLK